MRTTTGILMGFLALAASGCTVAYDSVALTKPANTDSLQVGRAPGPAFEWKLDTKWYSSTPAVPPRIEYTLTVSRDAGFGQPVYVGRKIKQSSWVIPPDGGWLPSPHNESDPPFDYYWKVEGRLVTEEGEVEKELACPKPRRFGLLARKRVNIEIHAPPSSNDAGGQVQMITKVGKNPETQDSVVAFEMEVGETLPIAFQLIRPGKDPLRAAGEIHVVTTTENMKHGTVIIENLNADKLEEIQKGTVADLSYRLGGDEIVKLKLGTR